MPQFYTPAASASSRPPRRSAYGYSCKSGKDFCCYYFCRLCNSNLHSQQSTHATSFQTFSLRSLSSSLLCQIELLRKNPRLASPPVHPCHGSIASHALFQALSVVSLPSAPCMPQQFPLSKFMPSSPPPTWYLSPGAALHRILLLIEMRFVRAGATSLQS